MDESYDVGVLLHFPYDISQRIKIDLIELADLVTEMELIIVLVMRISLIMKPEMTLIGKMQLSFSGSILLLSTTQATPSTTNGETR